MMNYAEIQSKYLAKNRLGSVLNAPCKKNVYICINRIDYVIEIFPKQNKIETKVCSLYIGNYKILVSIYLFINQ